MLNKHTAIQAKAILANDIIERDDSSFIHQTDKNRLGWEGLLPAGAAYSEFMLKVSSVEEALQKAYSHASQTVLSMAVPFRVSIEVSHQDDAAWTDRKKVHVSTRHFDEKWLTLGQKMDIFTGFTVHEVCHLLYTDFLAAKGLSPLARELENLIEDERIEHRLGDEKPGFANYLAVTKWYAFSRYCQQLRQKSAPAPGQPGELDEATRLLNAVIKLVRFRSALTDGEIAEFADPLIEIHDCLMPYPETPQQVVKKAVEVEEILRRYIKDLPQQGNNGNGQESDQNNDGDKEGQGGSSSNGNSGQNQSSGKSSSGSPSDGENDSDDDGKKGNGDKADSKQANPSGKGNGKGGNKTTCNNPAGQKKQLSDKEVDEIIGALTDILSTLAEKNENHSLDAEDEADAIQKNPNLNKLLSGRYEEDPVNGFICEKQREADFALYGRALSAVRAYIPAMRNTLRANSTEDHRTLTGMRSGTLDTGLLAEAFQGVPGVYRTMQTVKADPIEVCLLIDESGSMYGEKALRALETATLITEALSGIPDIGLSIYGYGRDYDCKLNIYKEKGHYVKGALGKLPYNINGSTPTGPAMTAAARRIRRNSRSAKCLMFILTDGAPDSKQSVINAVRVLEKLDIAPVAIGIEAEIGLDQQYKDYVYLTNLAALPKELAKVVKKNILAVAGRHVA